MIEKLGGIVARCPTSLRVDKTSSGTGPVDHVHSNLLALDHVVLD